jgi:cytochrome P450
MDLLDASAAPVRRPLPFTRFRRGIRARALLRRDFEARIDARRNGDGRDLFSELCRLTGEDGRWLAPEMVVDHFIFFLFAAFDTASSSVTAMIDELSRHPDWQERIAREVGPLETLDLGALDKLDATERALRETLRLMPPVPFLPRGLTTGFRIGGFDLPAGTPVTVCPGLVMIDPALWTDPQRFDPDRFDSARAEHLRHPFAWAPFGGGAHKCLGMKFAVMEARIFFACLLSRVRIARREPADWRRLPIPSPRDGLAVTLLPAS